MSAGEEHSAFIYNMGIVLRSSPILKPTDASKTKLLCSENGRKVCSIEGESPVLFILVKPEVINQGQFYHAPHHPLARLTPTPLARPTLTPLYSPPHPHPSFY